MMSWSNGATDPGAQYQQRPPRSSFFDSIRGSGWYRAQERAIGGVCSGIAARQGWDLSLVRIVMVVATFCMPVVAIGYGLAWLLLPEAADGRIHAEETMEGHFDIAVIGGVFMILAGLSSSMSAVGIVGGIGLGWLQLLALAAGITAVVVVLVSITRSTSGGPQTGPNRTTPQYGNPQYGNPQYGAPQYGTPQYGTPQQQASTAGASAPFGHSAPGAKDTGTTMPQQQNAQAPEGFPAYGVPAGSAGSAGAQRPTGAATSATQGTNAGPRPAAARPTQPHPGWTPPPSAPRPRQWTPRPMPTHRPRTVSSRANLAITGLLVLITAAVFAGLYWADKGLSIPFITGETADQTIARIITVGGGVCLLVVGLSLAVAALRDRSAGWLTTLSVIGIIMAFPTAAIGTQAARPTDFHINVRPGIVGTQTTRDWTVDRVSGGNPAGTTVLDLSGAPVGTTKTIVVDWEAWSSLTIQVAEGQPVQIVCQSDIETLSTNMDGDGWASALKNCSGVTASSPSWGKPSLGGITVLIADDGNIDTLTILQTPDSSGTWSSKPTTTPSATPSATPSTTPSTTPSPTPTGSQSGN